MDFFDAKKKMREDAFNEVSLNTASLFIFLRIGVMCFVSFSRLKPKESCCNVNVVMMMKFCWKIFVTALKDICFAYHACRSMSLLVKLNIFHIPHIL